MEVNRILFVVLTALKNEYIQLKQKHGFPATVSKSRGII